MLIDQSKLNLGQSRDTCCPRSLREYHFKDGHFGCCRERSYRLQPSVVCAQAELTVDDVLTTWESIPHHFTASKYLMFSRLSQLARHLSKPLPNYAHRSAAALSASTSMTSPSQPKQIHTAGCIIIGDEVLGGSRSQMFSIFLDR